MLELKEIISTTYSKLNASYELSSQERDAVFNIIEQLDSGTLRVADKIGEEWVVNEFAKQAILLYFKINHSVTFTTCDDNTIGYDKIPLKCNMWSEQDFISSGFRMVPGAVVRKGAYIGNKAILMPSFVNIGAYVGEGTMIDTWATVGSCAQIGKNCHISGGAGIGGVLEPIQASPVIIEDDVFIGARSEIAEGVIVKQGAVISMGVYIGSSTRIYDRSTDTITYGAIPEYSVVVPGALPSSYGNAHTYAAIIVKKVDASTRKKTSLTQILREI